VAARGHTNDARGRSAMEGGDEPPEEPNSIQPSAFSDLRFMQHHATEAIFPRGDGVRVSRPHSAAHVAANDAPLIDERAATRGRGATECGDGHAGAKRALSVRTAPSRTGSNGGQRESFVWQSAEPHCPRRPDEHFASALARPLAGSDAPLIGERAATRGHFATEGGHERAGVKRTLSVRARASRTGSNGGNALAAARPAEARMPTPIAESLLSRRLSTFPRNSTQNPAFSTPFGCVICVSSLRP
jgi:hypothetical protein